MPDGSGRSLRFRLGEKSGIKLAIVCVLSASLRKRKKVNFHVFFLRGEDA
jgi:hypothetical protein